MYKKTECSRARELVAGNNLYEIHDSIRNSREFITVSDTEAVEFIRLIFGDKIKSINIDCNNSSVIFYCELKNGLKVHLVCKPNVHFFVKVEDKNGNIQNLDSYNFGIQANNLCFFHSLEMMMLVDIAINNNLNIANDINILNSYITKAKGRLRNFYKINEREIRNAIFNMSCYFQYLIFNENAKNKNEIEGMINRNFKKLKSLSPFLFYTERKNEVSNNIDNIENYVEPYKNHCIEKYCRIFGITKKDEIVMKKIKKVFEYKSSILLSHYTLKNEKLAEDFKEEYINSCIELIIYLNENKNKIRNSEAIDSFKEKILDEDLRKIYKKFEKFRRENLLEKILKQKYQQISNEEKAIIENNKNNKNIKGLTNIQAIGANKAKNSNNIKKVDINKLENNKNMLINIQKADKKISRRFHLLKNLNLS